MHLVQTPCHSPRQLPSAPQASNPTRQDASVTPIVHLERLNPWGRAVFILVLGLPDKGLKAFVPLG